MESHKLIPDVTLHLVHFFYCAIDCKFNTDVDSTNKSESNCTLGNILDKLSKLLSDYSKYINEFESRDSTVESGKQTYTTLVTKDYKCAIKDARSRLPEGEYNFKVDEPVYNDILVLLQYLSPNNFIWHYHKDEERHLRLCCDYNFVFHKDLLTHYHVVSVCASSNLEDLDDVRESLKNTNITKNSDAVLKKINGIISVIHLPLKNNLKFECSKDGCSYGKPTYVSVELYNKANAHYSLFPNTCKLAIMGSRLICNCFIVLLKEVSSGRLKNYNLLISTLLILYDNTHGQILDDIYEVVLNVVDKHPNAFEELSNVLLFKEVVKKIADDINNYNNSVVKCTKCFVKLTTAVFNDDDVKMYELLESTIDKMKLMNNRELKNKFMKMYDHYLKRAPLACAATMLQMMELIMGALDTLDGGSVLASLKCLESMFACLPKDAVYYFKDVYSRFLIVHFVFLTNGDKGRDSLENMLEYEFFSELIVKVCIYSEGKVGSGLEDR
ncbi:conserved hypothetical protein [Theileria orientalis strain Shintoku]|uniref:Uncharacterized protein n=1 Tax=Theileria orientalis strain Shintoku TaxID=869250 RepID=J4C8M7_THEOR|nr:conserved hypothetical protein [Theileria orientalis strain Shintoku]BAM41058.1 conserved hypothetical protein [Theileria orientalis strain Shintoku]|eukprot:XP_009691359.1 conserved hypothetical protein [Theileria orientalis strain Shintoku]